MPRVRKQNTGLEGGHKRQSVRRVPNRKLQNAGIRSDAGRSEPAPGPAPAGEPGGDLLDALEAEPGAPAGEPAGGEGAELPGRPLEFSPELEAAAASLAAPAPAGEPGAPAADPGAPGGPPGAPGMSIEEATEEARELLDFAFDLADPILPSLAPIYTNERRAKIARAAGKLMVHYGYSGSDIVSSPWFGLVIAIGPVAIPTVQAVRADLARWRSMREAEAAAAPPPPADPLAPNAAGTPTPPPSDLHSRA